MADLKSQPETSPELSIQDLDDAALVAQCQAELPNDLTAYREIVRRYEGLIYNTCRLSLIHI